MYQRAACATALILSILCPPQSYATTCEEANKEAKRIYEKIIKSDSRESELLSLSLSELAKNNPDCMATTKLSKEAKDTLGKSKATTSTSSGCPYDRACITDKKTIFDSNNDGKVNDVD